MKSMMISRSSTVVSPADVLKNGHLPVVETNIFDLELPSAAHKNNALPPLNPPMATSVNAISMSPKPAFTPDIKQPD